MRLKPVNLIAQSALKRPLLKRIKAFVKQNKRLAGFIFFAVLFIAFLTAAPSLMLNKYRRHASSVKLSVESTKKKFKRIQTEDFQLEKMKSELARKEETLKQRLDLLSSTLSQEKGYSYLLLVITELLPKDLWMNRFIMNDNEIQISGSATESKLIAELMNRLEASKELKESRFISSEKHILGTRSLYNFQIATEPGWSPKKPSAGEKKKDKDSGDNNKGKGRNKEKGK